MRGLSVYAPGLLCVVGLLLSLEYKGAKYRTLLWVFRALSLSAIVACAVTWFVPLPRPGLIAIQLLAVAVNLPLAALGLKKNEKS